MGTNSDISGAQEARQSSSTVNTTMPTSNKPADTITEPDNNPDGIRRIENITRTWNRTALACAYMTFWGAYLLFNFQRAFASNVGPYVVSSFNNHSLLPTISLVSYIMTGVMYLPMAKAINLYGRAESHIAMAIVSGIGLILLTSCQNIETYAAGIIFTEVGFNGLIYAVDIITADTSMLKSRALAYAFTMSSSIITAFGGPAAAQSLLPKAAESDSPSTLNPIWRWSFGSLALSLPVVVAPLYGILFWYERRAARQNGQQRQNKVEHSAGVKERIIEMLVRFDVLGIFVLATGQVLFLLPFSLAASAERQWASGHIIAMIVIGIVLLAAFPFVEKRVSRHPFIPWRLLTDKTLLIVYGICVLFLFSNSAYQSYFVSYLQVVYDLSVSHAGYIDGVSSVVSGIWKLLIGVFIRGTGSFKWLLVTALAVHALFLGLLIYFRHTGTPAGLLVMCQIILGMASGTIVMCMNVGIVATVEHADIAATVALLGVCSYLGGAVGSAVSGAIWTSTLPSKLAEFLPESDKADVAKIYDSLQQQLSYAPGSPTRVAIAEAYAATQTWMLTAGTLVAGIALVLALMMKNIKLSAKEQVVGVTL